MFFRRLLAAGLVLLIFPSVMQAAFTQFSSRMVQDLQSTFQAQKVAAQQKAEQDLWEEVTRKASGYLSDMPVIIGNLSLIRAGMTAEQVEQKFGPSRLEVCKAAEVPSIDSAQGSVYWYCDGRVAVVVRGGVVAEVAAAQYSIRRR